MMKTRTVVWSVFLTILTLGMLTAQTVNVTFRVNTATVPDTVGADAVVQVRGGTAPLTWGNDTGGQMVNVGGDYWEVTLAMPANTADIPYKFFVNAAGDGNGNGWEADLSTGNRMLTTADQDMVLPVQFFNTVGGNDAMWKPYAETADMDVYFRVNMQANQSFDPATQTLMVKGGTWPGAWGELTWNGDSTLAALSQESNTIPGQFGYDVGHFFSGKVTIPNDSVAVGQSIPYKFVIVDKNTLTPVLEWEGDPNRTFNVPAGKADTTLKWDWWNRVPYVGASGSDSLMVKFRVDLTNAINENGFTPGEDTIIVRYGANGTAVLDDDTLTKAGLFGNFYEVTSKVEKVNLGSQVQYNYYNIFNGTADREIFYDYETQSTGSDAEKRKFDVPTTPQAQGEVMVVRDTINSTVEMHRQPKFRNLSIISQNVYVSWEVDLRPAYYQVKSGSTLDDIQGDIDITPADLENIMTWGVWINGPATRYTSHVSDWTGWGSALRADTLKQMRDDGVHLGDLVANDSIFTTQFYYSPDSNDVVGQVFKFGIYGGDNEAGSGGFGNNHLENIAIPEGAPNPAYVTIHSDFGSINPAFYTVWDFDNHVLGLNDNEMNVANSPVLNQNYPNPFNPSTKIQFTIPKAMPVKLVIYNSLGQKVRTLLNGMQRQGLHIVNWSGMDDRGRMVASGVYFYRLEAGDYQKSMKMVLMK